MKKGKPGILKNKPVVRETRKCMLFAVIEFVGTTKERKDCVAQEKLPLRKPILTAVERQ